ncbi:MAG TPA: SpoIIE family protein phosphatase [Dermatophilaceae bacterium]|nr:SpoIIE family protein phosphatase [Dermatophilaceae bacterium]
MVSSLSMDGRRLEVALVDVSGKGREAGTRALLLSGGLGGLIGSLPPADFLPAANAYLIRQRWAEGFATVAHLAVDLTSGEFSVGTAGHPAPAQFRAGSGSWRLVAPGGGPLLGVMAGVSFRTTGGPRPR